MDEPIEDWQREPITPGWTILTPELLEALAEDRDRIAQALYALDEPEVWEDVQNGEEPAEQFARESLAYRGDDATAILPLLAEARQQGARDVLRRVQAVYDMQCPVGPPDDYTDRGALAAHAWWERVLGGALDELWPTALPGRQEADR